jgi:hypothetical protein
MALKIAVERNGCLQQFWQLAILAVSTAFFQIN